MSTSDDSDETSKQTCPVRVLPNKRYVPCSFGMARNAILATYRTGPWEWLKTRKFIAIWKRQEARGHA